MTQPAPNTLPRLYHGTHRDFDQFNIHYAGQTDDGYYGRGFYFTPCPETALQYGPILIEAEITIKNPLRLPDAGSMGHPSLLEARDILCDLTEKPSWKTIRTLPEKMEVLQRTRWIEPLQKNIEVYYAAPKPDHWDTPGLRYGREHETELEAIVSWNDELREINLDHGWLPGLLKEFDRGNLLQTARRKGFDAIVIWDAEDPDRRIQEIIVDDPTQIRITKKTG